MAQQVKLMGPHNLKVFLSIYLAPIYAAKKVLTQKEGQDYRLAKDGGDPEAKKEVQEEFKQETGTNLDTDQEPVLETSDELQEQQPGPHSENKTQSREEPTGNPPQEDREVEKPTRSEEQLLETDLSQGPTLPSLERPALKQEAQGEYNPDPTLGVARSWQMLQDQRAFGNFPGPDMAPSQQAKQIVSWAGLLQKDLIWWDREWKRVEKLLNCSPNMINSGVLELVQHRDTMANRNQELEEMKFSLEMDCKEAQNNIIYLKSEVRLLKMKMVLQGKQHTKPTNQHKAGKSSLIRSHGRAKSNIWQCTQPRKVLTPISNPTLVLHGQRTSLFQCVSSIYHQFNQIVTKPPLWSQQGTIQKGPLKPLGTPGHSHIGQEISGFLECKDLVSRPLSGTQWYCAVHQLKA